MVDGASEGLRLDGRGRIVPILIVGRIPVNRTSKRLKKDKTVVTKETVVGEVTMNPISHPECRAGTAGVEPATKTTAAEPTAVRGNPAGTASDEPSMKSAAAEPGAARARFRRGGQCQKDAHDKQWDFHTNKPAFLLFGRNHDARQIALRQPVRSSYNLC